MRFYRPFVRANSHLRIIILITPPFNEQKDMSGQRMKETTLGIWDIGNERIELAVRAGYGAEYYYRPEARIVVGIDHSDWSSVVGCLLHESFEFVCDRSNARYDATNNHANDNGAYLFVMTHALFSDACEKSANFMTGCMPAVMEAWKAYHNPRKKKAAQCRRNK